MSFSSRKSFTVIEVLIIIGVLTVGLLSILAILRKGFAYVQESRQKIIALDLAREGIEAVYQIRNTNWKRWSAQKNECWLKKNPFRDELNPGCQDDPWMFSRASQILETSFVDGQRYFLLSGFFYPGLNVSDGINSADSSFRLCLSGGVWLACPGFTGTTSEGTYFREIYGYGLFMKSFSLSGGHYIVGCTKGTWVWTEPNEITVNSCGDATPKEYVFCSRVVYGTLPHQEVSLCGSITNFASDNL